MMTTEKYLEFLSNNSLASISEWFQTQNSKSIINKKSTVGFVINTHPSLLYYIIEVSIQISGLLWKSALSGLLYI